MNTSFKNHLLEYYKGKNSTIGFRYSEPKLKSNIKILLFSNYFLSELNNILKEKLDNLLNNFSFNIEIINDIYLTEKTLENMPNNIVNQILTNNMDLYMCSINLITYDEDEILSLLIELSKNNEFFIGPTTLLNDRPYDITKKHRVKSKIGFKI